MHVETIEKRCWRKDPAGTFQWDYLDLFTEAHSNMTAWKLSRNWSICSHLCWDCAALISFRHMLRLSSMCSDVIIISAGLSCWLSSNVMALRQSPELRVILRAGCRHTGDIKERDESRRMNLGFCWIYSSGLSGSRSACSAACPNWRSCVCEGHSDGGW